MKKSNKKKDEKEIRSKIKEVKQIIRDKNKKNYAKI